MAGVAALQDLVGDLAGGVDRDRKAQAGAGPAPGGGRLGSTSAGLCTKTV
jgi:hypothetical protein